MPTSQRIFAVACWFVIVAIGAACSVEVVRAPSGQLAFATSMAWCVAGVMIPLALEAAFPAWWSRNREG